MLTGSDSEIQQWKFCRSESCLCRAKLGSFRVEGKMLGSEYFTTSCIITQRKRVDCESRIVAVID